MQIHHELSFKIDLQHLAVYSSLISLLIIHKLNTKRGTCVILINVSSVQGVYAFIIIVISKTGIIHNEQFLDVYACARMCFVSSYFL